MQISNKYAEGFMAPNDNEFTQTQSDLSVILCRRWIKPCDPPVEKGQWGLEWIFNKVYIKRGLRFVKNDQIKAGVMQFGLNHWSDCLIELIEGNNGYHYRPL